MKPVYIDEGAPAWFEPETDADRALLDEANQAGWPNVRLLVEARKRGLISETAAE